MNLSSYPHLVKEWHPTKNGDLTPDDFTHGTLKKVWWLCPKGHSYNGPVARRTAKKPSGCPYCAGKKASAENSLISLFPDVAKEWHPLRNSKLKLNEMTYGSKKKAWWLCPNGHNYETMIIHRTVHNSGCPYCSGHKPSKNNNLSALFPEIAKEWHPTKNGKLIPKKVTSKANKKVWWLCPKGHSYESLIGSRTGQNTGCPYCSGLIASESNNLLAIFPNIAQEWHPTKNHNLKPSDLSYGSNKKVWWLCDKGHDYKTSPHIRTGQKSGCPFCINHSSQPEIRILSELKWIFEEVNSRYKINKTEIDVYIPQFNLGIEYDGSFWHKNKEDKDLKKNNNLLSYGINLIRVRHHPLKPISKNDVIATKETLDKNDLNSLVKKVESFVDLITKKKINTYLTKSSFVNEDLFKKYLSYFPSPFPENSILKTNPLTSIEWDYDKNYPLRPENFSFGSHNRVWWLCPNGHSYEAVILQRTATNRNDGCPYCAGKKPSKENNLSALFPEISKEWHPTKNAKLTPEDFTRASNKKVWWLCDKGHSYDTRISSRTLRKAGCPYCIGRRVSKDNNLLVLFPEIAKEWHPTKNDGLTPDMVTYGSRKSIWWLCSNGHSFESTINHRTRKSGTKCPYCSGRKTLNFELFK